MSHIKQLDGAAGLSREEEAWHRVYNPSFGIQAAWKRFPNAFPLSYGGTITTFSNSDGRVAFREGATHLDYGADLGGATVYLVSSSASDTGAYLIQGIDANGDYAEATVTATGTTPVAFSGTWKHVQRLIHTTDGSFNAGTVYVSAKSGAGVPTTLGDKIQVVMGVGDNYAINPELWCPNDYNITINRFDFSQSATQDITIRIMANRQGQWILNFKFFAGNSDQFAQDFSCPIALGEGERLRIDIQTSAGAGASGTFGMNGIVTKKGNGQGVGRLFA